MHVSSSWRKALATVLVCAAASHAAPARAQLPTTSSTAEPGDVGARKHFERALELYRSGRYADALPELEQAAKLDPRGKDLFFNLSLVHEKLGQFPEAITALERFQELETDPKERERARLAIERLRGAELATRVAPASPPPAPCPEPSPAPPAAAPPAGPSPVLIGAASVAVVSVIVGSVFGAKALSDDVSDSSTSASFSAAALRERGRRAEREALVADIAFALALASGATFAGVWVLAPAEPRTRAAGFTLKGYF